MAFAQPIALYGLLLFIPVALLYLLKQRRRRVRVATLLFWDQVLREEHSVAAFTRLRKLLSLLLQLLFIALLTFTLARPLLSADLLGSRRMVILLDTSASMTVREGEGTRFDMALRVARNAVRGMSLGDTCMLVTVSDRPDIVCPFTDSRKELLDHLEEVEFTHGASRFDKALALIEHLPNDKRETCVYLITDGAFDPIEVNPPEDTRFAYLRVGRREDNVGITRFALRPLPGSPRDFEILFTAANTSEETQRVPFELREEGSLIDAGEIALPPKGSVVRTVRQFSQTGGEITLALDHADAFPLDNTAYAAVPPAAPCRVLLVTEGNLFLESALATHDEILLDTVEPGDYEAELGQDAELVVFDDWAPDDPPESHAVYIAAWPAGLGVASKGAVEDPLVTDWVRDHPINRHLRLMNISIGSALEMEAPDSFTPLISSFERPLVLLNEEGEWHSLIIGFDTASSDLPLRVAFPILLANAIRHLTGRGAEPEWTSLQTGAIVETSEAAQAASALLPDNIHLDRVRLRGPNLPEEGVPLTGASAPALIAASRAGVYPVAWGEDAQLPLFAANLCDPRETDIAGAGSLPLRSERPIPEVEDGFRLGMEPWFFLAMAAFALSCLEWVLYHRRIVE